MFTKRHYIEIAKRVRRAKNRVYDLSVPKEAAQLRGIMLLQDELNQMFSEDNVNFNMDTWNEACSPK